MSAELIVAMREAVEEVPGLGDHMHLYGTTLPKRARVVGLGILDPRTGEASPGRENHLQIQLSPSSAFGYPHDVLTRVIAPEEEVA